MYCNHKCVYVLFVYIRNCIITGFMLFAPWYRTRLVASAQVVIGKITEIKLFKPFGEFWISLANFYTNRSKNSICNYRLVASKIWSTTNWENTLIDIYDYSFQMKTCVVRGRALHQKWNVYNDLKNALLSILRYSSMKKRTYPPISSLIPQFCCFLPKCAFIDL